MFRTKLSNPLAITMWDFSWLERRWTGAGYEDWDLALDELKTRGYDAVRIDAYPHLVAADPEREWELLPCWTQQVWGSPALNRVRIQPGLNNFIEKCAEHGMKVGLSTWFREDRANTRMQIESPQKLGQIWQATLDQIAADGLLEHILYVDLCNEFALPEWAPFVSESPPSTKRLLRNSPEGVRWINNSIAVVRQAYPDLDYCFSVCDEWDTWEQQDVSAMDLLEPHVWMAGFSDFNDRVGYHFDKFKTDSFDSLMINGERTYRENPEHWQNYLKTGIETAAEWSRRTNKPLITTECWSIIDYKDWPLLNWDWIKELCEIGVRGAASTGRWAAIGTSNFCGPQFIGMWRDIEWHRRMTDIIHSATLP